MVTYTVRRLTLKKRHTTWLERKLTKKAVSFLKRLQRNGEYRIRFVHTVCVLWMFITLGWSISVIDGTFPDLRLIIQKDLQTASWIFTASAFGLLVGSFFCGLLFDRFNRLLVLIVVTSLNAASITAFPWCSTFPTMVTIAFINGVSNGGISTGGHSHIGILWGQAAAPYMQPIHLGYSIGGILSPLSAEPFLAPKLCQSSFQNIWNSKNITNQTGECEESYGETHIHYAYVISGVIPLSSILPFVAMYMLSNKFHTYVDSPIAMTSDSKSKRLKILPVLTLPKTILFVSTLMLLASIYVSGEARFAGLLTTFLVEYFNWSTAESLHLAALFWGMFASGRFVAIFLTRFIKTPTLLLLCFSFLIISMVGLFCAAKFNILQVAWVSTALAGLCMSVIFPSIFTWTAESIIPLPGKIAAAYNIGMSIFGMVIPLLFGYMMDNFGQMYFVYLLMIQFVAAFLLYLTIRILIRRYLL